MGGGGQVAVVVVVVENNRIVVEVVVVVAVVVRWRLWWWWWNTWKVSSLFTAYIHCRYSFPQFFSVQRKDTTLRCGVFWCFWLSFCVKLTSMDY